MKTPSVEQLGKELDREMSKKQRLEDELEAIAQELHNLIRRIQKVRRQG